jgi:hypothetical protein
MVIDNVTAVVEVTELAGLAWSVEVVGACVMAKFTGAEVLDLKLASPS